MGVAKPLVPAHAESRPTAFQRAKGLVVDGVVGPRTWGALQSAPKGSAVVPVQPASNSCWTVVGQPSNYAYTCDFSGI
ncbi:peptidoglycan-binding domain-containing protein [Streptomyces sp. NPDC002215]|uniref:peptidoglycan-binding domain-containing protein n=1 Tax=Streptomyces sp. NPDC002215 TaxID=3154412 RepID=UPI0033303729